MTDRAIFGKDVLITAARADHRSKELGGLGSTYNFQARVATSPLVTQHRDQPQTFARVNHNPSTIPSTHAGAPRRLLAKIQGTFYAASGIWPWVHGDSFQKITGYKSDFWLAQTVGLLVLVIGGVLYLAARADRLTREIMLLAMLSAAGLLVVDLYTQLQPHTTRAYILDAFVEAGLLIAWTLTGRQDTRSERPSHLRRR